MRWQQGRARVEEMLRETPATLQQVQPSREHADRLLRQSRAHLATAAKVADDDPAGAYGLLYDAARKALTAVLENQGLRPTSRGVATWPGTARSPRSWTRRWVGHCGHSTGCVAPAMMPSTRRPTPTSSPPNRSSRTSPRPSRSSSWLCRYSTR